MSLKLFEDTKALTALAVPLGAVVAKIAGHLLSQITVTRFKRGEGLWTTIIEPIHADHIVGILIFAALTFAGYRAKNTILQLFGLGGLLGWLINLTDDTLRYYKVMPTLIHT